jgi:hypothetical protein
MGSIEHSDEAERRIGHLEDELKQRDRRINELKQEVDELEAKNEEMREHVQTSNEITEQWIEAFEMVLDDDETWSWNGFVTAYENMFEEWIALKAKWNKFVPKYNAVIAPRGIGRPLAASGAQQHRVMNLHKSGMSLRSIVKATNLGLGTVRTIIGKANGTDRTTKRTNELRRLELNRANMNAYRARRRTRDALPKKITEFLKHGRELMKTK